MMENYHSDTIRHYNRLLPELMDTSGFYEYALQVYNYLELMEPGTILTLQTEAEKLPWLLVTVGAFLADGEHWMDFELNDDYTKIRRKYLPPQFLRVMRGEKSNWRKERR